MKVGEVLLSLFLIFVGVIFFNLGINADIGSLLEIFAVLDILIVSCLGVILGWALLAESILEGEREW